MLSILARNRKNLQQIEEQNGFLALIKRIHWRKKEEPKNFR